MRRRIAGLALTLAVMGAGCTADEVALWMEWHAVDPVAADAYARAQAPPDPPVDRRCTQWWDLALAAGFTEDELPTVGRIMFGESNCRPEVVGKLGEVGLMQIIPGWAAHCGVTPHDLFDPATNLACAVKVRDEQGWNAWAAYR